MTEDPLGFTFIENKPEAGSRSAGSPLSPGAVHRCHGCRHADDARYPEDYFPLCPDRSSLKTGTGPYKKRHGISHSHCYEQQNVVVPRLIPVINHSIPLFVESTENRLQMETIETHWDITNAIAAHDPVRAQDAMYLHLVYNRKQIHNLAKLNAKKK